MKCRKSVSKHNQLAGSGGFCQYMEVQMQTRKRWTVIAAMLACVPISSAFAEPEIPDMNLDVAVDPITGKVTVDDPNYRDGLDKPLRLMEFYKDTDWTKNNNADTALQTNVCIDERQDGFDMVLTLTNSNNYDEENPTVGSVDLAQFRAYLWLLPEISIRDTRICGDNVYYRRYDSAVSQFRQARVDYYYPGDAYSPVLSFNTEVLGSHIVTLQSAPLDGQPNRHITVYDGKALANPNQMPNSAGHYTFGMSVLYPAHEYQHAVYMQLIQNSVMAPGSTGDQARLWRMYIRLNPTGDHQSSEGRLLAGDSRVYRFCMRISRNKPDQPANWWLRTLEPYRKYFGEEYGKVHYTRDPRPVAPRQLADQSLCSTRPFAYAFQIDQCAGRTSLLNTLQTKDLSSRGFQRSMIWAASGLHCNPIALNYPFLFATHLYDVIPNATDRSTFFAAIRNTYSQSNRSLGLWWGRSVEVMSVWNQTTNTPLQPLNTSHQTSARAELDIAETELGAREIGLDAFVKIPAWRGYQWLTTLQQSTWYPNLRFIVEPRTSDLIHSLTPMYLDARQGVTGYPQETPHFLADFLLPGHEIWSEIAAQAPASNSQPDIDAANAASKLIMQDHASRGFVTVPMHGNGDFDIAGGCPIGTPNCYDAAESWKTTTAQLRVGCQPADIANDDGLPFFDPEASTVNNGVNEGDYNAFFQGFFNAAPWCDIANDDGSPLPPFGTAGVNNGVNEGDYNCFFQHYFDGCPAVPVDCTPTP